MLYMSQYSFAQTKSDKQKQIEHFKSEMKKLNDSSAFYFDKGIKLLKEGVDPIEIAVLIKPKLAYLESEIIRKARGFSSIAENIKLSQTAYNTVLSELMESFQDNRKKYEYLTKNGVKIE